VENKKKAATWVAGKGASDIKIDYKFGILLRGVSCNNNLHFISIIIVTKLSIYCLNMIFWDWSTA
jgi:hypothetical protein